MGHFIITLPKNRQADVRYGTVRKATLRVLDLLHLRKMQCEERRGYMVRIDTGSGAHNSYLIFKNLEGEWMPQEDDETTTAIKVAIDAYESKA
jgi:hypothetical protein